MKIARFIIFRKSIATILIAVGTSILFSACTEKIKINLDETYVRLVVDGVITSDTTIHRVHLSTTSSFYYNEPSPVVTGAILHISDGNNSIVLHENLKSPGTYETDSSVYGLAGKVYTLDIELKSPVNGLTHYQASCEMRPVAGIDSVAVVYNDNWKIWEMHCYALDPITTDYYMFNIFKNGVLETDTINEVFVTDDRLYNGNHTNGAMVGFLSKAKSGEHVSPGDTLKLQIAGISREYYHFILDLQAETGYKNPLFGGPPANIAGNINNGAIGFFAAYSVKYARTIFR